MEEMMSMPISPKTSLLSELRDSKPISAKKLAYYRRRFQNRIHALILKTFLEQEEKTGLTQKDLAARVGHRPETINRWLSIAGNWELNTVSDLLLGMLVDLDDPSVTPVVDLVTQKEKQLVGPKQPSASPIPAEISRMLEGPPEYVLGGKQRPHHCLESRPYSDLSALCQVWDSHGQAGGSIENPRP
jgi:hypothetical protein